jgi:hypothetical protein
MNYFQFHYFCGALLLSILAYMFPRLFAVKWLIILKSLPRLFFCASSYSFTFLFPFPRVLGTLLDLESMV